MKEIVEKTLKEIEHPEIAKTLFELGMIEDIRHEDVKVSFTLKLPFREVPIKVFFCLCHPGSVCWQLTPSF